MFAECFPRQISFSDVDGIVEINGNGLLLEWKPSQEITTGQRIMYTRLTRTCPLMVIVVAGDAQTMVVSARCVFREGRQGKWKQASLDDVKRLFSGWARWAERQPIAAIRTA